MATILIVDDDQSTIRLLQTLLELEGFDVVCALRGSEVPAAVADHRPDLLMMDYNLMDVNGLTVLRTLRAVPGYAQLPIVMVSGMDVEQEAKEAGATEFLVKPFDPDALTGLFHQLIQAPLH